mmetsp:Transcript_11691/g.15868  ORF Transcript_11691/g.15868 Transcript_11691/m.15868 type:complete len:88 (+) Transcript_11691:131-394(+)
MVPIMTLYIGYVCVYRCMRRKRKAAENEERRKQYESKAEKDPITVATLQTEQDMVNLETGRTSKRQLGIQISDVQKELDSQPKKEQE